MTAAEKPETKQKIIQVARQLFSQHGFTGTSVRQIAEASDVNVAAINYHFGSKEALYWAIIADVYVWMDEATAQITAQSKDVQDLARNLFRFMREYKDYAMATMKTFLSDQAPPPEAGNSDTEKLRSYMGPPGGEHIAQFLKQQFPEATDEGLEWMVMCLFSSIFHFAVITCSMQYDTLKKDKMPVEKIEANILKMAEALSLHMSNKKFW
jgi:AcrR family transcriptional regulator